MRVFFVLDQFTGGLIDESTPAQFHTRFNVQSGPGTRFVDFNVDAALLILESHEISKELLDASLRQLARCDPKRKE